MAIGINGIDSTNSIDSNELWLLESMELVESALPVESPADRTLFSVCFRPFVRAKAVAAAAVAAAVEPAALVSVAATVPLAPRAFWADPQVALT